MKTMVFLDNPEPLLKLWGVLTPLDKWLLATFFPIIGAACWKYLRDLRHASVNCLPTIQQQTAPIADMARTNEELLAVSKESAKALIDLTGYIHGVVEANHKKES